MAEDIFFIAGTDTGCGKTLVAECLLETLKARGMKVVGMKPVATGAEKTPKGLINSDALRLQTYSSNMPDYADVNPFVYEIPCSPNIAADKAGREINLETIGMAYQRLRNQADIVIVEGIGGWRVPLSDDLYAGEIAGFLKAPVILVVGLRLGCINHALLSVEAIERDGIPLKGWIANYVDPDYVTGEETIRYLKSRIGAPLLGVFPCINNHSVSGGQMCKYLDVNAVL